MTKFDKKLIRIASTLFTCAVLAVAPPVFADYTVAGGSASTALSDTFGDRDDGYYFMTSGAGFTGNLQVCLAKGGGTANGVISIEGDAGGVPNNILLDSITVPNASFLLTGTVMSLAFHGVALAANTGYWMTFRDSAHLANGQLYICGNSGGLYSPRSQRSFDESTWIDAGLPSPNFTFTVASAGGSPPPPPPSPGPAPTETPHEGTINVVTVVVNDNGGTKTIADFPLFVSGIPVLSGVTNTFSAPASAYAVTEVTDANYVQTFSGGCDQSGRIGLSPGDNKFCVITNDDIGAPVIIPPVPPLIDVVKVPSPLALPAGPGPVIYTYTLRNIGTVPVNDITMVGDSCSPVTLVSGDNNSDSRLDVNETWIYTCRTMLSETHTNTVTATGWANGVSAVDVANATVVVGIPGLPNTGVVPPLIHVTKVPNPPALPVGGGMVTFTNSVTNPGAAPLSYVRLIDDRCGLATYIYGDTNANSELDTTETWIYTCRMNLTKTTTNSVIAEGTSNGIVQKDLAVVTVLVAPGLPNMGSSSVSTLGQQVRAITSSLSQGSRGADVSILQQFLISENKGHAAVTLGLAGATGYFGALTRTAVAEFQVSVGITPALGYFGPITRAYLRTHY